MKIAITSTGDSLDSTIDPRFGRCAFFAIHDTDSESTEFVVNTNKELLEGAGPSAVRFVAGYNVSVIVSGEFGLKVKPLLEELSIKAITHKKTDNTVADIIRYYKLKNGD
ncbi:MAG: NifB/NifX family molybdenum-iron cluster-binding protein [Fermentimonas sp.]|nr:NifB/NifX family molybdenum-iron cluster-binding protein [Fermentimonas sp.]MDD4438380.1 NifB/NifX family molybdenum-iron cluster-binding protein [Tissierellia bacterium]